MFSLDVHEVLQQILTAVSSQYRMAQHVSAKPAIHLYIHIYTSK